MIVEEYLAVISYSWHLPSSKTSLFRSSSFSLTVVPSPASQVFYGSSHPFLPSVILSLIFDLNKLSKLGSLAFATRLFFLSVGKIAKSGRIPFSNS